MSRVYLTALLSSAVLTGLATVANSSPPNRPNIVFIMSDDHAAHAVSAALVVPPGKSLYGGGKELDERNQFASQ